MCTLAYAIVYTVVLFVFQLSCMFVYPQSLERVACIHLVNLLSFLLDQYLHFCGNYSASTCFSMYFFKTMEQKGLRKGGRATTKNNIVWNCEWFNLWLFSCLVTFFLQFTVSNIFPLQFMNYKILQENITRNSLFIISTYEAQSCQLKSVTVNTVLYT